MPDNTVTDINIFSNPQMVTRFAEVLQWKFSFWC